MELMSQWVATQTSRLHTFLPPSSFSIPCSHFFSQRKRSHKGGGRQSQLVEADQGAPLLKLGPAPQQRDQPPLAPPFPGAPGTATRNCPGIADRSWQGLGVASKQTFLSRLCPGLLG